MINALIKDLRSVGYYARRSDALALATALSCNIEHGGSRAMLLSGPPGTGKSAFAKAVAELRGAAFFYYQCHSWSDSDELFSGVNITAAVAGDSESVHQPGVLAAVAEASHSKKVVLLLDEIDKTQERTEALLLAWMETGLVPTSPTDRLQTNLETVTIIITSNDQRPLSDALLRRASRVWMNPLPLNTQLELLMERTGIKFKGVVGLLWKLARAVAAEEGNGSLSIQEGHRFIESCWNWAKSNDDIKELASQWAARTSKGRESILSDKHNNMVNAAWAELVRARGR